METPIEMPYTDHEGLKDLKNAYEQALRCVKFQYEALSRKITFNEDEKGLCKSAIIEEIKEYNYVLTPGRYVGFKDITMDEEEFKEKFSRLSKQLREQMGEGRKLDAKIEKILELLENENS